MESSKHWSAVLVMAPGSTAPTMAAAVSLLSCSGNAVLSPSVKTPCCGEKAAEHRSLQAGSGVQKAQPECANARGQVALEDVMNHLPHRPDENVDGSLSHKRVGVIPASQLDSMVVPDEEDVFLRWEVKKKCPRRDLGSFRDLHDRRLVVTPTFKKVDGRIDDRLPRALLFSSLSPGTLIMLRLLHLAYQYSN